MLDPIVRYQGKILDGRNRYRACGEACLKISHDPAKADGSDEQERLEAARDRAQSRFTEFEGDDDAAKAFVGSKENRRHSTKGQRAMGLAILYPEPEKGGRGKKNSSIIEGFGVSRAYVSMARVVLKNEPVFAEEVEAGTKSLSVAYDFAKNIIVTTSNNYIVAGYYHCSSGASWPRCVYKAEEAVFLRARSSYSPKRRRPQWPTVIIPKPNPSTHG